MNETSKSKPYWGDIEKRATTGRGIDIGCGPDPVTPQARGFDKDDGDANQITKFVHEQFDFVYSSHCLEHMHDPRAAILEWWKLVKPGGYLFVLVPDEDLYEQGVFPSRFNDDHKATFTISKAQSWSSKSVNVLNLGESLPGGKIVSLQLQDRGYDRTLMSFGNHKSGLFSRLAVRTAGLVEKIFGTVARPGMQRLIRTYYPVDQTGHDGTAQAQIQLIVQKAG